MDSGRRLHGCPAIWGSTVQFELIPEYPLPWRRIEKRSGIMIKDAAGATVMMIQFTGEASKDAKWRVARLVLEAVNGSAVGATGSIRRPAETRAHALLSSAA